MRMGAGLLAAATTCALLGSAATANASADLTGVVPSARLTGAVPSARAAAAVSPPPTSAECLEALGVACYRPRQLQRAYGLGPLYARGYSGRGRTVVIVDPIGSPTLGAAPAAFDPGFGPAAPPPVPPFDPSNQDMVDKAGETTLDVEWAHAMAPGADILLVETPAEETATGGGFPQMIAAENYVIEHNLGDVISQSFSLPEQNFPSRAYVPRLRYAYVDARRHRVTVLGASNDNGVTGFNRTGDAFYHHRVLQWPASDS